MHISIHMFSSCYAYMLYMLNEIVSQPRVHGTLCRGLAASSVALRGPSLPHLSVSVCVCVWFSAWLVATN